MGEDCDRDVLSGSEELVVAFLEEGNVSWEGGDDQTASCEMGICLVWACD